MMEADGGRGNAVARSTLAIAAGDVMVPSGNTTLRPGDIMAPSGVVMAPSSSDNHRRECEHAP